MMGTLLRLALPFLVAAPLAAALAQSTPNGPPTTATGSSSSAAVPIQGVTGGVAVPVTTSGTIPTSNPGVQGSASAQALILQGAFPGTPSSTNSSGMLTPAFVNALTGADSATGHYAGAGTGTVTITTASSWNPYSMTGSYKIQGTGTNTYDAYDPAGVKVLSGCTAGGSQCTASGNGVSTSFTAYATPIANTPWATLHVASTTGTLTVGAISCSGQTSNTVIMKQLTGSAGSTGTYQLNFSQTFASVGSPASCTQNATTFQPTVTAGITGADTYYTHLGGFAFAVQTGSVPASGTGSLADLANRFYFTNAQKLGNYVISINTGGSTYTMVDPDNQVVGSAGTAYGSSVSGSGVTFTLPSASYGSGTVLSLAWGCPSAAPCKDVRTAEAVVATSNPNRTVGGVSAAIDNAGDGLIMLQCSSTNYPASRDNVEPIYSLALPTTSQTGGFYPVWGGNQPSAGHRGYLTITSDGPTNTCSNGTNGWYGTQSFKASVLPTFTISIGFQASYVILDNLVIVNGTGATTVSAAVETGPITDHLPSATLSPSSAQPPLWTASGLTPNVHHIILSNDEIHGFPNACAQAAYTDYFAVVNTSMDGCATNAPAEGSGITLYRSIATSYDATWPWPANLVMQNDAVMGSGTFGLDPGSGIPSSGLTDGNCIIYDTGTAYSPSTVSNSLRTIAGLIDHTIAAGCGGRGVETYGYTTVKVSSDTIWNYGQDDKLVTPRVGVWFSSPASINTQLQLYAFNDITVGNTANMGTNVNFGFAGWNDRFMPTDQDFIACSDDWNTAAGPYTVTTKVTGTSFWATPLLISYGAGAPLGPYKVQMTSTTAFSVTDPNGTSLGTGAIGTPFTSAEINFSIPSTYNGQSFTATTSDAWTLTAQSLPQPTLNSPTAYYSSTGKTVSYARSWITEADPHLYLESNNVTLPNGVSVPGQYAFLIRSPGNLLVTTTSGSPVFTLWSNNTAGAAGGPLDLQTILSIGPTTTTPGGRWATMSITGRSASSTNSGNLFLPAGDYPLWAVSGTPSTICDNSTTTCAGFTAGTGPLRYALQGTIYKADGVTTQNSPLTDSTGHDATIMPFHTLATAKAALAPTTLTPTNGCHYGQPIEQINQEVQWPGNLLNTATEQAEIPATVGQ